MLYPYYVLLTATVTSKSRHANGTADFPSSRMLLIASRLE